MEIFVGRYLTRADDRQDYGEPRFVTACSLHAWRGAAVLTESTRVGTHRRVDGVGMALLMHVGRQVGTSEARLVDAEGKLYAHATTTCAIFEAR